MGSKGTDQPGELSSSEYQKPGEPESSPAAVGRRIAQLRGKMRQEDFAAELGIHSNTLGRYERGEKKRLPDGELLIALSRARGVSSDWVLFGLPPMGVEEAMHQPFRSIALLRHHTEGLQQQLREKDQLENMVYVPLYDVEVGAGRGKVAPESEHIITYRVFDRDWLQRELTATEADVYLVKVRGDSNYSVVNDGDVILVDKRVHDVIEEGCYVIRIEDTLSLKFGQRLPGGLLRFWGANEAVSPPFTVNANDPNVGESFSILGRAWWRGGKIIC